MLVDSFFSNFYSNFSNFIYYDFDELLTILFVFNFFKLVVWSSIFELLWPTQFFNRKNNIFYQSFRFRTFVEFQLKLNSTSLVFSNFYKSFINYYFNKN